MATVVGPGTAEQFGNTDSEKREEFGSVAYGIPGLLYLFRKPCIDLHIHAYRYDFLLKIVKQKGQNGHHCLWLLKSRDQKHVDSVF